MKIKAKVFEIIQPAEKSGLASRVFDAVIMILIFVSIVSVFVGTFDISRDFRRFLFRVEKWTILIFTVEYLLRIWTADLLYPALPPWRARLTYMKSAMAVVDLLAILPFYLPMLLPINLLGMRALRLFRLLRLFKLRRYSEALGTIAEVFRRKKQEIALSVSFVSVLLIIASLLMYHAEHDAQPEQFANAFSGLWWAVATLTTVGYGDIYPITAAGRILGAIIAIMGIGMVAIPTGIISAGFMEMLEKKPEDDRAAQEEEEKKSYRYCPHCGKKL